MSPRWVTIEGVNGVGKTRLAGRAAERLAGRCLPVAELTDLTDRRLPGRVIAALSDAGGTFLRTGRPLTETFALLALKVREYERVMARLDAGGPEVVLEDRGVDTVAVYQSLILAGAGASDEEIDALAQRVYAAAARWRPPPDRTILLIDDLDVCLDRFERRIDARLSTQDRALVRRAQQSYARQALREPARFLTVDRAGRTEEEAVSLICDACLSGPRRGTGDG